MDGKSGYQQVYTQLIDQSGTRLLAQDIRVSMIEETADQESPAIAMTGSNSATIGWTGDSDFNTDIFSQSIDQTGNRSWPTDKRVNAGNGTAKQITPAIAADPAGNAVVVWRDLRNESCAIYAQALDSSGNRLWKADQHIANVRYCQATDDTTITANTSGNFLIVWSDGDIFAQLLDISGNRLWPSNLVISAGSYLQESPAATALTNGEFIITWVGWGTGTGETSIFAHRVDTLGTIHWPGERQVNSVPDTFRLAPAVAADSSGSSIIVWQDQRNQQNGTPLYDIYAQRLDIDGNRTWLNDLQVSDPNNSEHNDPQITGIAGERFIVTWQDPRLFDSYGWDIFAQRIDSNRTRAWTNDLRVNTDSNNTYQGTPMIISNADGQALVAWTDNRNGNVQIYAQRLDATGKHIWASDMQATKESTFTGEYFISSTRDQNGNAIIVWQDARFGNGDTFIQKMGTDGIAVWSADLQLTNPDYFYFSEGAAQSLTVALAGSNIRSATLTSNYQANSGSVQFSLSNNGGTTWEAVTPGINHIFISTGKELRWMINLNADPAWSRSPVVNSVNIEYSTDEIGADPYENDNTCDLARPIGINGAAQTHTIHQPADADWAWFDATAGTTYVVETINSGSLAQTEAVILSTCSSPLSGTTRSFGNGFSGSFSAAGSARHYIKISHPDPTASGPDTSYTLSLRAMRPSALALIVAGQDASRSAENNILFAADRAYRVFLNAGLGKANVRYLAPLPSHDADGDGHNDVAALSSPDSLRDSIQSWARERGVGLGVPLYIYLVDHGLIDRFKTSGNAANQQVNAANLNLWLSNLQATTGADNITLIIDACYSGSFIDVSPSGPDSISGHGRVIITSASSSSLAYGPADGRGLYFSNAFFSALESQQSVWASFSAAREALAVQGQGQLPFLDDNGDQKMDSLDGSLAAQRALVRVALGGQSPQLTWLSVDADSGLLRLRVSDDSAWVQPYVEIFSPSFQIPVDDGLGTTRLVDVPVVALSDPDGDGIFEGHFSFAQFGSYRLVAQAEDAEGNLALPTPFSATSGSLSFLPFIKK
jgi:hypothetical protein